LGSFKGLQIRVQHSYTKKWIHSTNRQKKTRFLLTNQHIQTDPLPPIRSGTKVPVLPIRNDTKELRQDISRGRRVSPKNRSKAKRILFNQETEV
jgi:hypothetical protein